VIWQKPFYFLPSLLFGSFKVFTIKYYKPCVCFEVVCLIYFINLHAPPKRYSTSVCYGDGCTRIAESEAKHLTPNLTKISDSLT